MLVAVSAGEVEVRLGLVEAVSPVEAGVAHARKEHWTGRFRGVPPFSGPGVVGRNDTSVGIAEKLRDAAGLFQYGKTGVQIQIVIAFAVNGMHVSVRVAVTVQSRHHLLQPADGLIVIGYRALSPCAVHEKVCGDKSGNTVHRVVDIIRFIQDPSCRDKAAQQRGIHVAECRRITSNEGHTRVEEFVFDSPNHRLVQFPAVPDEVVSVDQCLRNVHVCPPVPLGGAVVLNRIRKPLVAREDDFLAEGQVVVDAVPRIDFGEAVQNEGRPTGEGSVSGRGIERGKVVGGAGEIGPRPVPALGLKEMPVPGFVFPVRIFLGLTHGVDDAQDPGVREFLVRIFKAAVSAEDTVRVFDCPVDLALLGSAVAVGTAHEVDARAVRNEAQNFTFR